jgi:Holliday junction resolvase RusA-like endonuclease
MLQITIPGRPVPKKNNAVMVASRSLILPSKAFREYAKFCIGTKTKPGWLMQWGNIQFTAPVNMQVLYWLPDKRWWPDLLNLLAGTADLLQDAGILENDKLVAGVDGSRIMGLDKDEPRAEITITMMGEN